MLGVMTVASGTHAFARERSGEVAAIRSHLA